MQDQRGGRLVLPEPGQISLCLSNLMLTGVATPYCHNGLMEVPTTADQKFDVGFTGNIFVGQYFWMQFGDGKLGIVGRNEFGFLYWDCDEAKARTVDLGSRYRTPVLPLWLTCIQDSWGVLFSPNKDQMKSHAAQNRCRHTCTRCLNGTRSSEPAAAVLQCKYFESSSNFACMSVRLCCGVDGFG